MLLATWIVACLMAFTPVTTHYSCAVYNEEKQAYVITSEWEATHVAAIDWMNEKLGD